MRTALFKKYYPKMDTKSLGLLQNNNKDKKNIGNNNNDNPAETEPIATKKSGDCRIVAVGNTARVECQTN